MEYKTLTMDVEKISLKQRLMAECVRMQKNIINNAREAMQDAQLSANEHEGAMEEKFDSYREELQNKRDLFARQLDQGLDDLAFLNKVNSQKEYDTVMLGAVVITEMQHLFISISLGKIEIDDQVYFAVSPMAPIYKAMAGLKKGDVFEFRGKKTKILDVF